MIRRRMFASYLGVIAVALLLAIGLCLGPIHMIMCDACTVKLRGSQYGYLQYYDEFTEVWHTVYAYKKWDLNGEYHEEPLRCESKEELEKYREKFKTVNDVKSFMENEKKKYDAYKESKYIY